MPNWHINFKKFWEGCLNPLIPPPNTALKVGKPNLWAKQAKNWNYCRILCHDAFLGNFRFFISPNIFQEASASTCQHSGRSKQSVWPILHFLRGKLLRFQGRGWQSAFHKNSSRSVSRGWKCTKFIFDRAEPRTGTPLGKLMTLPQFLNWLGR